MALLAHTHQILSRQLARLGSACEAARHGFDVLIPSLSVTAWLTATGCQDGLWKSILVFYIMFVADFCRFFWIFRRTHIKTLFITGCLQYCIDCQGLSNLAMNWMGGARKKNNALDKKREPDEARQRCACTCTVHLKNT